MYNQSIAKRFISGTACMMLLLGISTSGTVEASGAGGSGSDSSVVNQQSHSNIKVMSQKPEVAPVPKKNQPNRIITNFNGDTKQKWLLIGIRQINLMMLKFGCQSRVNLMMHNRLMQLLKSGF